MLIVGGQFGGFLVERRLDHDAHLRRRFGDVDAGVAQGGDLSLGAAFSTGDDGAGVSHPPSRWRRQSGDEGNDRLRGVARIVFFEVLAACSSIEPPISPIITIPSVFGSARNPSRQSIKSVPLKGSPPIPTQTVWPRPTAVV